LLTSVTPAHQNNNAIISEEMNRLLSAANKLNKLPDPSVFMERNYSNNNLNVDKPTQPFIVTMYEDYPQPFTSKSINYISSANLQTKKVKMTKKPKTNNKQRVSSGSKTANKSKQKNQGPNSSKTNNKSKSSKLKNKGIKKDGEEENETLLGTDTNETITEDIKNKNDEEITLKNEITNYETDDFEAESADSSLSDDDENDKSNVISDTEENSNLKHSTSENDIYLKSLGESTSEEVIIKKTNNRQNKNKTNLNENTVAAMTSPSTKLNKDMIQSFEDRVFAIYNKFDILLSQQENILDNKTDLNSSKSKEANEKLIELNEQKVQFSQEMARELSENVNFDEITSNPELVKRLKSLYTLVKTNGNANENDDDKFKQLKKPPLPEFSKNSISKKSDTGDNNNNILLKPRKSSVVFASIKSNADIREVYSMINTMGSKNDNENFESTVKSNKNNSLYSTKTLNNKIYKLPDNLSDKLNDLMVPLQINEENKNEDEDSNELTIKPGAEVTESFEEPNFNLDQVSKLKINYVRYNLNILSFYKILCIILNYK
jgi:hypothetical protein